MEYQLIRSFRKNLAIQIKDGNLIVRAPKICPTILINKFLKEKESWINKHLHPQSKQKFRKKKISQKDYKKAQLLIRKSIKTLSKRTGLQCKHLKFSNAKNYWGYCRHDNIVSINWRLAFAPQEVLEYVIIHELAHTVYKNHSKQFWDLVNIHCSDYKKQKKALKEITFQLHSLSMD